MCVLFACRAFLPLTRSAAALRLRMAAFSSREPRTRTRRRLSKCKQCSSAPDQCRFHAGERSPMSCASPAPGSRPKCFCELLVERLRRFFSAAQPLRARPLRRLTSTRARPATSRTSPAHMPLATGDATGRAPAVERAAPRRSSSLLPVIRSASRSSPGRTSRTANVSSPAGRPSCGSPAARPMHPHARECARSRFIRYRRTPRRNSSTSTSASNGERHARNPSERAQPTTSRNTRRKFKPSSLRNSSSLNPQHASASVTFGQSANDR